MNQLRHDLMTKNELYYRTNMLYMLNVEESMAIYPFVSITKETFVLYFDELSEIKEQIIIILLLFPKHILNDTYENHVFLLIEHF